MARKTVLLVEGSDDQHVVKNIMGSRNLGRVDEIKDSKGIDGLLEKLPVQLKESDIAIVGVVVDADEFPASRWQSLTDILKRAGYTVVPSEIPLAGAIIDPPQNSLLPRVGLWMMPDNENIGSLEDFLKELADSDSELVNHAKTSLESIPASCVRFPKHKKSKALVHTWLAWQEEPGKPYGQGIKANYLNAAGPAADPFVAWLRNLFFSTPAHERS